MHFYQSTESPRVQRRQWVEKVVMAHPPKDDRNYDYANANYMLAGAILEELTDQSWEDLMTTKLIAPLGMAGVGFGSPGDHQPRPCQRPGQSRWRMEIGTGRPPSGQSGRNGTRGYRP